MGGDKGWHLLYSDVLDYNENDQEIIKMLFKKDKFRISEGKEICQNHEKKSSLRIYKPKIISGINNGVTQ